MDIECEYAYVRPIRRGIVFYEKEGAAGFYIEDLVEDILRERGSFSPSGGARLYNVKLSIEWEREEAQ